jgi:hypothetical protein
LMALIPVSRVLGSGPSVVGCVSRAVWFLVGRRARSPDSPVEATPARFVVYSVMCWSGATPRSATFGCSSGVARAVRWMLSGWMLARLRLYLCVGALASLARFCAPAGAH